MTLITPGSRDGDDIGVKGRMELFATRGRPRVSFSDPVPGIPGAYRSHHIDIEDGKLLQHLDILNILVNQGKDAVIESLASGTILVMARMAIGDRGTIPSDSTVPKIPVSTMTGLYNEIYRADFDGLVLNVGTPSAHEIKFIKTFSAADVPITSFSNQALPVINEVGIVMADLSAIPLPRVPVAAPNPPPADEKVFAIRTFKSIPFEVSNDISVTIRYTIFIE